MKTLSPPEWVTGSGEAASVTGVASAATEIDFLRSFNKLDRLSYNEEPGSGRPTTTFAEFWKDFPRIKPLLKLRAEAMKQLGGKAVLEMEVQSSARSAAGNVYLNSCPDFKKVENVAIQIRAEVAAKFNSEAAIANPAKENTAPSQ